MGTPLKNPPLAEALVQFQFQPDDGWDWTIPGIFYEKLEDQYPKRETVTINGMVVDSNNQVSAPAKIPQRIRFIGEDQGVMIQVGPGTLVLNRTKNYEGWDEYLPEVMSAFSKYTEVLGTWELSSIGVRYINAVPMAEGKKFEDYISLFPKVADKLKRDSLSEFHQSFRFDHQSPEGTLLLQVGTRAGQLDHFLADYEFMSTAVSSLKKTDKIKEWLTEAHDIIENAFTGTFTDNALTLFREG